MLQKQGFQFGEEEMERLLNKANEGQNGLSC